MSWRESTFPRTRDKWDNIKYDLRGVKGGMRWFMVESRAGFYADGLKLSWFIVRKTYINEKLSDLSNYSVSHPTCHTF